jgi:hypothetical protein
MKVYTVPEFVTSETHTDMYMPSSYAEAVVGGVASGVSGAVAGVIIDSIPGPAIPG